MATTTPANVFPSGIKPFKERKLPKLICMFDVDGTLNPARQAATPEMISILKKLRGYTATAFVSGSDLKKIEEQLNTGDQSGASISEAIEERCADQGTGCLMCSVGAVRLLPIREWIDSLQARKATSSCEFYQRGRRGAVSEARQLLIAVHERDRSSHQAVRINARPVILPHSQSMCISFSSSS